MSHGLRALILGAGYAGEGHTLALQRAGVEVVAMASRTASSCQAAAQRLGIPHAGTDWRALLAELKPEIVAVATPGATVGPLICWDQWYPEAARLTALRGAEILVYPTAIGWHPSEKAEYGASQLSAWQTIQRAHAIANGVFVVAVNRVGHEGPQGGGIEFWGHSFVADPFGVVLAEAGEGEEVLVVDCDLGRVEEVRRNWPFLRDRRIDAYAGIGSRLLDG